MKQIYAILLRPPRFVSKGGMETERLGTEAAGHEPARLEYDELDDREAANTAHSEQVEAMAPLMDTFLAEPFETCSSSPGSDLTWGIQAVGATSSAWSGKGVTAAVLDTGIDADHPCFEGLDIHQQDLRAPATETAGGTARIARRFSLAGMSAGFDTVSRAASLRHTSARCSEVAVGAPRK